MGIALSSSAGVVAAIRGAREVDVGAYVLAGGAVRRALADAARRGARVSVTLAGEPYHDADGALARENARAASVLRAAGAAVTLAPGGVHLKAAVCDEVAFLDDRNWGRDGVVVRDDDARDVGRIRDALAGRDDGDAAGVALSKQRALSEEAAFIDGAADGRVVVATEAFGVGPVAHALLRRAARGGATRLIVDARRLDRGGATLVRRLRALGVAVDASVADEKFVLAGDAVWVGSANATSVRGERGDQSDWGLITRDPAIVASVRAKC